MDLDYIRQHDLILLECISGSRAYNLDVPGSDTDIRGIYYLPKSDYYGLNYVPQISNETNDIVFYEIGRFIELLSKNNPNILELLETPADKILFKHPVIDKIKTVDFLSKKCKDTFGGYAFAQIRKARGLNKKIVNPVGKVKKTILEFCYVLQGQGSTPVVDWLAIHNKKQEQVGLVKVSHFRDTYGLYYDEDSSKGYKGIMKKESATTVLLSSVSKGEEPLTFLQFNEDGYTKYCKDYKEYWDWVDKRNENRYTNTVAHGKNYDAKNMMHTFRLLDMAKEILLDGKINVKRENRAELLSIRKGEWDYEELILKANEKMEQVEEAFQKSTLPDRPNREKMDKTLVEIRTALYG